MFVESLLGFLGNLLVHGAQEGGQAFKDGDFCTQTTPDRAHFQTDHAGTDQGQLLGHCAHAQSAVVRQHIDFVKRRARQGTGVGAGGDDDVFAGDRLFGFA